MDDSLPSYDGPPATIPQAPKSFPTTHTLLNALSGQDTCTVIFKSRAASTKGRPVFYPGDTIEGEVKLKLSKKASLKALEIKVL